MKQYLSFIFLLLTSVGVTAEANVWLRESFSNHRLELSLPWQVTGSPVLFISVKGADPDFVGAVIKEKLARLNAKVRVSHYLPATLEDLSVQDVLSSKLVIEVEVANSSLRCRTTLVSYKRDTPQKWTAIYLSSEDSGTLSLSASETPAALASQLRRQIEAMSFPAATVAPAIYPGKIKIVRLPRPENEAQNGAKLQLGLMFGTPALANTYFGLYRPARLPIEVGVSGMYYSSQTRGFQFEGSALLGQIAGVEQKLGFALAFLNESRNETVGIFDAAQVQTGTEITTIQQLRPHVGPVYGLGLKHFRGEIGLVFPSHVIFQIGYVLPFSPL